MKIKFTLIRLFKDCPKPSGWFACRARLSDGTYCSVRGVSYMRLVADVDYVAKVVRDETSSYGRELEIADLELSDDKSSVLRYLTNVTGDAQVARDIYKAFGKSTVKVLISDPDKVAAIVKDKDLMDELVDAFVVAAVGEVLRKGMRNVSRETVMTVVKEYGMKAREVLSKEPYRLLEDFPCTFRFGDVDKMALADGMKATDPRRVNACIHHGVKTALDKDITMDVSDAAGFRRVADAVAKALSGNGCGPDFSGKLGDQYIAGFLRACGDVVLDQSQADGHTYVYTKHMFKREGTAASVVANAYPEPMTCVAGPGRPSRDAARMAKAMSYLAQFEKSFQALDPSQRDAVAKCLDHRISALTGGPGVGKTTTVKALVYVWHRLTGRTVFLLAPTWLALKNMSAAVHSLNLGQMVHAMTVQSFTKVMDIMSTPGENLVIVDESSMVGFSDGSKILEKCGDWNMVFVGDTDQLPSISAGDFFHDLIQAIGWEARLTECHRVNSKVLKDNADAVNGGLRSGGLSVVPGVFELQPFPEEKDPMCGYLARRYMEYMADRALEPKDMVILCGMHKGPAGTDNLNQVIRDLVVKPAAAVPAATTPDEEVYTGRGMELKDAASLRSGCSFRVGDRVIALENRHGDYTNGDMGTIVSYKYATTPGKKDKSEIVLLRDGPDKVHVTVPVDRFRSDFDLAYAVTVHKSQGCEWPVVLVSVQPGLAYTPGDFASRPLLYTAMTRGKDTVELVGSMDVVHRCASTCRHVRRSRLAERVARNVAGAVT